MPTPLTAHFALEELTCTLHRSIDNTPPPEVVESLHDTARRLEAVRTLLGGRTVTVSSGYRSAALNRAVGGAPGSAHLSGRAVDFNCYGFGSPRDVCRAIAASNLDFDQLIEEGTWIHISFAPRMRRQILRRRADGGYALGLAA